MENTYLLMQIRNLAEYCRHLSLTCEPLSLPAQSSIRRNVMQHVQNIQNEEIKFLGSVEFGVFQWTQIFNYYYSSSICVFSEIPAWDAKKTKWGKMRKHSSDSAWKINSSTIQKCLGDSILVSCQSFLYM